MQEIFKDIKGYEGLYQVSNLGRVRSLDKVERLKCRWGFETTRPKKGRILTPRKHTNGYLRVGLKEKDFFIHRLVAEAFIHKLKDKPEVNHIDGNKQNNRVDNLEWCNRQENNKHAFRIGLRTRDAMVKMANSEKRIAKLRKRRKLSKQAVFDILNLKTNGFSDTQISKLFNISSGNVYEITHEKIYKDVFNEWKSLN